MQDTRERLTADGYPQSWYAATRIDVPAVAPLDGETRADVCVIGGGYSGLSAALHLGRAGVRVVLLEAERLGWGASGRNGGQVHVGMRRDQAWLEANVGEADARALWNLALDARNNLDDLIARYTIQCDLTPGYLHADHKARYLAETRTHVDHLQDRYGYDAIRFVTGDEMRALVGSAGYHGGYEDRRGGHLHALNLAMGLARGAIAEGGILHDRTRVTGLVREGAAWRVETERGVVRADTVLLACNGYLRGLSAETEAHVMPINNFVGVTAPLGKERAETIVQGGRAVSDSRFVVYYFRITPDHRLLFGGGESYSWRFPRNIAAVVRRHMLRVFPQLADVALDHAWGGTLAITPNRLPFARTLAPGLMTIAGYSGLGVVIAPYLGRLAADAIANGSTDFDRLARLPVPRFPGGKWLRWPTLVAAMSALALRDRI